MTATLSGVGDTMVGVKAGSQVIDGRIQSTDLPISIMSAQAQYCGPT